MKAYLTSRLLPSKEPFRVNKRGASQMSKTDGPKLGGILKKIDEVLRECDKLQQLDDTAVLIIEVDWQG